MRKQKTWLTVDFYEGVAHIELTINYRTKTYSLTHSNNDNNVTFNGNIKDFKLHTDRLKCINAALQFANNELK